MCRFCSVPLPVPNPDCHILFLCFLFGGICAVLCCAGLQCAFLKNKQTKKKNQTFFFGFRKSVILGKGKKIQICEKEFYLYSSEWILKKCSFLNKFCRMPDPSERGLLVLKKKCVRWWLPV